MRLIVNHRDFPFRRDTRLARVVDVALLVLLLALVGHIVRQRLASPASPPAEPAALSHQLVLTIHADGRWTVAGQLVPPQEAEGELRRLFAGRRVKVLFIAAAPGRPYGELLAAAEQARAAGIPTVGFLPPVR